MADHAEHDSIFDQALDAMDAQQLRKLIKALMPWLDDRTEARLMNEAVVAASWGAQGWSPPGPNEQRIEEIEAFATDAGNHFQADPCDVDNILREGNYAFLGREYPSAVRIFRALLLPICECGIDLGHH